MAALLVQNADTNQAELNPAATPSWLVSRVGVKHGDFGAEPPPSCSVSGWSPGGEHLGTHTQKMRFGISGGGGGAVRAAAARRHGGRDA